MSDIKKAMMKDSKGMMADKRLAGKGVKGDTKAGKVEEKKAGKGPERMVKVKDTVRKGMK